MSLDKDALRQQLLSNLFSSSTRTGLLGSKTKIRESAFHNFSYFEYLLSPKYIGFSAPTENSIEIEPPSQPTVPTAEWIEFDSFMHHFDAPILNQIDRYLQQVYYTKLYKIDDKIYRMYIFPILDEHSEISRSIQAKSLQAFRRTLAPVLYEEYRKTHQVDLFIARGREVLAEWVDSQYQIIFELVGLPPVEQMQPPFKIHPDHVPNLLNSQNDDFWSAGAQEILTKMGNFALAFPPEEVEFSTESEQEILSEFYPSYDFPVFEPGSYNFGFQLVYRQGWTPLGTQPGEIIRTLPLGPKQSEKITVKAVRKTKSTRQSELSSSVETSTESSAATKDSEEVIQEASESFNWHVESEASVGFGFGSAKVTAGAGGDNASSSKDTKSSLSEVMEKTASKVRKDTKIIISTEVESTSEFTQVSEISNPNDDVAVTYIYSRLQRQYEIQTYLSEVNTVVFVAERIPAPHEINGEWIRRYDWILSRELLDESFRSDLQTIKTHDSLESEIEGIDQNIRSLMETISSGTARGIPNYNNLPGQIPDLFQNQQQSYEREVERHRARKSNWENYKRSLLRLRTHIYDNILHYCRAIWSSEDPDSRLLRYSQVKIPVNWRRSATGSSAGINLEPEPGATPDDFTTLADMINPAGPIGYAGNYSAFYLKESTRWATLLEEIRPQQASYFKSYFTITRGDTISSEVQIWAFPSNDSLSIEEFSNIDLRYNKDTKELIAPIPCLLWTTE